MKAVFFYLNRICILLFLALGTCPVFTYAQCIDVSSLDIEDINGIQFEGLLDDDQFGYVVDGIGDFNGDGLNDFIISAYTMEDQDNSVSEAGEVFVFFGTSNLSSPFDLSSLDGTNGFVVKGVEEEDQLGYSVSKLGDVNNDGFDDFIIGIPGYNSDMGAAMVLYGHNGSFSASMTYNDINGTNGILITGEASGNNLGWSVGGPGDVNGDHIDDIMIGAPDANNYYGKSYVLFGSNSFSTSIAISSINGTNGFVLEGFGYGRDMSRVFAVGDLNNDGINEMAVSSNTVDYDGRSRAGAVSIIYGQTSYSSPIELSDLDGNNGFIIPGLTESAGLGISVASAGDVNQDGIEDLILGGTRAQNAAGVESGAAYVIYGNANASAFPAEYDLSALDGSNGFSIEGSESYDYVGGAVGAAGDINNDGLNDLIVGAYYSGGRGNNGSVYVLFGKTTAWSSVIDIDEYTSSPAQGFEIYSGANRYQYGISASELGDVNEDGFDDLIIGASNQFMWSSGRATIIFGNTLDINDDVPPTITCPGDQELYVGSDLPDYRYSVTANDNCTYKEDLVITQSPAHGTLYTGSTTVTITVADEVGNTSSCSFSVDPGTPNNVSCNTTSIDCTNLNGTDGFVAEGIKTASYFGSSVDYAGDFNGDGIDDFIVGAKGLHYSFGGEFSNISGTIPGAAFLVFGKSTGFKGYADMSLLDGTNGFMMADTSKLYTTSERSGYTVSGIGDINGDGFDDVVVTDPFEDCGSNNECGYSFVIFGNNTFSSTIFDYAQLDGSNGFIVTGSSSSQSGTTITGMDINGDGYSDLVVSARTSGSTGGKVYVIFGKSTAFDPLISYADLNGNNGFIIEGEEGIYGEIGYQLANIGDFNHDGIEDLAMASTENRAYILYGHTGSFASSFNVADLNGSNGIIITNDDGSDMEYVYSAGDFNNDGISDCLLSDKTTHYVLFGGSLSASATFDIGDIDASKGFPITNLSVSTYFDMQGGGDFNGDGIDDILINNRLIYGRSTWPDTLTAYDLEAGQYMRFLTSNSIISASIKGDYNNDGYNDLLLGERSNYYYDDSQFSNPGKMYAVFGFEVSDQTAPEITCLSDQTVDIGDALEDYTTQVSVSDDCDANPTITQSPAAGGTITTSTTVTIWAADNSGNIDSCQFIVAPEDAEAPVLTCPADQTVACDASGLDDYTTLATATDNVDTDPEITQSPAAGTAITDGMTVTLTATDDAGNESNCSFTVQITADTEVPAITCPADETVSIGSTLSDYTTTTTATDNCDGSPTLTQSPAAGTVITANTVVTITATDVSGNEATCTFTVNAEDTAAPVLTCPADQTVACDASGLDDYTTLATATDNVDTDPEITQSPAAGTAITDGMTVTLTATDDAGNESNCSFTVQITADTEAPAITCPSDETVSIGSTLSDYTTTITVTDNCDGSPEYFQSPSAGTLLTANTVVTLTAIDVSGNEAECTFTVYVTDTEAPVISCLSEQFESCEATGLSDYTTLITVTDNADANPEITQSPAAGTTLIDGMTVTLTATDNAGNTSYCSFTVSFEADTEAPVFSCPNDVDVACGSVLDDFISELSIEDNCDRSVESIQTPAAGSIITSDTKITIEVWDQAGNIKTCQFMVYVDDVEVDAGEDVTITSGNSIQLQAITGETGHFLWQPETDLNDPESNAPLASPTTTTTYTVLFTTESGCETEDDVTITVESAQTKYGFSPNNDGINDVWTIYGIEQYPDNKVSIYNRWGDLVFEMKGYDNEAHAFSGIANRNTGLGAGELPEGTYFFHITVPGGSTIGKTSGYLILKR